MRFSEGNGGRLTYFSSSVKVFVSASSTRGQFPSGHVIFVPVELLLLMQYAAAEYWEKKSSWSKTDAEIAALC